MAEEQLTQTSAPTTATVGWGPAMWFGAAGGVIAVVGLLGTVLMWSDMTNGDVDYATLDKWLAILAGLTVVGVGLTVAAIGAVLAKLER